MKSVKLSKIFLIEGGTGVPAYAPYSHIHGKTPHAWSKHGYSGDPDSAPTVTVNRLLQNTTNQADIEMWAGDPEDDTDNGLTFDAPFTQGLDDYGNLKYQSMKGRVESVDLLKNYVKSFINEESEDDLIDEDELTFSELGMTDDSKDETSSIGGGSIRGYTGPLGQKPMDPNRDKVNQKSFGDGIYDD